MTAEVSFISFDGSFYTNLKASRNNLIIEFIFSNEEDHNIYTNRLSIGTLTAAGSVSEGSDKRSIFQLCTHFCCLYHRRNHHGYNGALPSQSSDDEVLKMSSSRSCNTLYPDTRHADLQQQKKWASNGYKARSTDDLMENVKGDSVYTILIQFPAVSLPDTADTAAADTTSITLLSDDLDNSDTRHR